MEAQANLDPGSHAAGRDFLGRYSPGSYCNSDQRGYLHQHHQPTCHAGGTRFFCLAIQTGRFFDGGASNIAFATSTDGGNTWVTGNLPGITRIDNPSNPYDRVSDPAVAYDPNHNVWMISSLALLENPVRGVAVITSRSTDGGLTWGDPVVVSNQGDPDKNWIACDSSPTSPFYGNCYTQWDDFGAGNRLYMSTSTDGGLTWGPRLATANNATGIGGQPVVQPNGTVIVPADNAFESSIIAFRSTDGGASWSSTVTVSTISDHAVAGSLRSGPLPSAEVDASGRVYVVWQDCRFRNGCRNNDIVMSTSRDGLAWSRVTRIPIDDRRSRVDHFIPGLAVDNSTAGGSARLGLTYYYYPNTRCSSTTCQLSVGYVSSSDHGATWTAPVQLAGPINLTWLANTNQGRMVGDYISTSFSGSAALPVFSAASAPIGSLFDQAAFSATGLTAAAGTIRAGSEQPVANAASDHPVSPLPLSQR
jgi:hypothetical protein